jgi:hypothetical protein
MHWLFVRYWPAPEDPWEKIPGLIPVQWFALGSRMDVGWYFTGQSKISVQSLEDVQRWLWRCDYVPDTVLFREPDYWQHPQTFEQLRRGDCEDFALWAWRKLVEMKVPAEFVVGHCQAEADAGSLNCGRHAWVIVPRDGQLYLYEPTIRDYDKAVQLLDVVRHRYVPEFGIGADLRPFAYSGYMLTQKEHLYRPQERPVGAPS